MRIDEQWFAEKELDRKNVDLECPASFTFLAGWKHEAWAAVYIVVMSTLLRLVVSCATGPRQCHSSRIIRRIMPDILLDNRTDDT